MHITDSFEHELRTLAKSMRLDLLNNSQGDFRECALCGVEELEVDALPPEGRVEFYTVSCPEDGCDGSATVVRYIVETPPELPFDKERVDGLKCTELRCTPAESRVADAIHQHEPDDSREYHLPTTALVNSRILEHHTSYEPERIIDVCYTCHGLIHSDSDVYSDLEPEQKRSEVLQERS